MVDFCKFIIATCCQGCTIHYAGCCEGCNACTVHYAGCLVVVVVVMVVQYIMLVVVVVMVVQYIMLVVIEFLSCTI